MRAVWIRHKRSTGREGENETERVREREKKKSTKNTSESQRQRDPEFKGVEEVYRAPSRIGSPYCVCVSRVF